MHFAKKAKHIVFLSYITIENLDTSFLTFTNLTSIMFLFMNEITEIKFSNYNRLIKGKCNSEKKLTELFIK